MRRARWRCARPGNACASDAILGGAIRVGDGRERPLELALGGGREDGQLDGEGDCWLRLFRRCCLEISAQAHLGGRGARRRAAQLQVPGLVVRTLAEVVDDVVQRVPLAVVWECRQASGVGDYDELHIEAGVVAPALSQVGVAGGHKVEAPGRDGCDDLHERVLQQVHVCRGVTPRWQYEHAEHVLMVAGGRAFLHSKGTWAV